VRRSRASSNNTPSPASKQSPLPENDVLVEVKTPSNNNRSKPSPPVARSSPVTTPDKINKLRIDREEINNVKTICVQLLKAHKKMSKQMTVCKDGMENQSKLLASMGTKEEILESLMKEQRSQFFRNWIALDIKERAYQGRMDKMEQKYILELEKRLESWTGSMRLWNESTRERLQELQSFVDFEAETNEQFRSNMTDWIEKFQQDQKNDATRVPAYVFATNLGEIDEKVPLCGAFGGWCGYGTGNDAKDTKDIETDPIIGADENTSPLKRVKKRPWRPLFKNWDRIPLVDEK